MKKIGAITVGQSPRTDLIPEMEPILGDTVEIIQMGGLDGLTREEIAAFRPRPNDYVLVSRLADGTSVSFGESYVLPRMQECIHRLEDKGVSLILFLCTGQFPDFESKVHSFFPNNLLYGVVPVVRTHFFTFFTPAKDKWEQGFKNCSPIPAHVILFLVFLFRLFHCCILQCQNNCFYHNQPFFCNFDVTSSRIFLI